MKIPFKYVSPERDQYGATRYRFRAPWKRCVMKSRDPQSADFRQEYDRLMNAAPVEQPEPVPTVRVASLDWLCNSYMASAEWKALKPTTRVQRAHLLRRVCAKHGHRTASAMLPINAKRLRDEYAATPGTANQVAKSLRTVFAWGVNAEKVPNNPFVGLKRLAPKRKGGWPTWTVPQVRQFIKKHPRGTKAYLAAILLLFTALRRSDVVRLGPTHLDDGWFTINQAKGDGMSVSVPMMPMVVDAIASTTTGLRTYLVTDYGKPFSVAGFGNKFREWCDDAGLHGLSAHGLRKAAGTLLAEFGCTEHEIMSVLGHSSPKEGATYTRSANRRKLSESAFARLGGFKL